MPAVSIVLPTYNRADVIRGAIDSVVSQSFTDWELIVIDDGSTDDTPATVRGIDDRIRVLEQPNAGCYAARNRGIEASTGEHITFLDSDDRWLPHFLELTTGFLRASLDAHFVCTEFYQDYNGEVSPVNFFSYKKQPAVARAIGSRQFDLPPGETDDYLRVYSSKEEIGAWGSAVLKRLNLHTAYLYRGNAFPYMRWGYLFWLPTTMITRHAAETVGPFPVGYRNAADYYYTAQLARNFRANFIAVHSAIKYDRPNKDRALREGHLASGSNQYSFCKNRLGFFDELFWNESRDDPELTLLRKHYEYFTGHSALLNGLREQALPHLKEAACLKPILWRAYWLLTLAYLCRSGRSSRRVYRGLLKARFVLRTLVNPRTGLPYVRKHVWRLLGTAAPLKSS